MTVTRQISFRATASAGGGFEVSKVVSGGGGGGAPPSATAKELTLANIASANASAVVVLRNDSTVSLSLGR